MRSTILPALTAILSPVVLFSPGEADGQANVGATAAVCSRSFPGPPHFDQEFDQGLFASASASASGGFTSETCAIAGIPDGASVSGAASASAEAVAGTIPTLKARAEASGWSELHPRLIVANGVTFLHDTITVTSDSGTALDGQLRLDVVMRIDGFGSGFGEGGARLETTSDLSGRQEDRLTWCYYAALGCSGPGTPGTFDGELSTLVRLAPSFDSFDIVAALTAGVSNSGLNDSSGTASIEILLPPGFAIVSGSGMFERVPEPGLSALLGLGLGLSGCARLRGLRDRGRLQSESRPRGAAGTPGTAIPRKTPIETL